MGKFRLLSEVSLLSDFALCGETSYASFASFARNLVSVLPETLDSTTKRSSINKLKEKEETTEEEEESKKVEEIDNIIKKFKKIKIDDNDNDTLTIINHNVRGINSSTK